MTYHPAGWPASTDFHLADIESLTLGDRLANYTYSHSAAAAGNVHFSDV